MTFLFNRAASPTTQGPESLRDLGQMLTEVLPGHGSRSALRWDDGIDYRALDWRTLHANAVGLVHLLRTLGGDRRLVVATLTLNRPEWDALAHAVFHTGNTLAPLDTKMNAAELGHLAALARPDLMLVSRAQLARARDLVAGLRLPTRLLVADLYPCFEDLGFEALVAGPEEIGLAAWLAEGQSDPSRRSLPPPSPRLADPDTPVAYFATSGTTALPKLVAISHRNLVAETNEGIDVLSLRPNEEVLSIGPRTHIATLVELMVTALRGYTLTYCTRAPDADGVLEAELAKLKRQGVRIKGLMGVPKLWIHLLKELLDELKRKPAMLSLYEHLIAIERHGRLDDLGTLDKAKLAAVRIRLKDKLGGYFAYGISSSARLDAALVRIFGKLGITLIDVYGATETTGIVARNRLDDLQPGTCGRLIRSLEYRVVGERATPGQDRPVGELQVRGPTVALGYVGQAPGSHLDRDGWFATGDLAWVDEGRIVHLVGRAKELIEWDDGRLVDPLHLSNLLVRSIFVKDALVTRLAPADDHLSVFLYPDRRRIESDPQWQAERRAGVGEGAALRRRLEPAIAYAQSLIGASPRLGGERIYLLERPLERTPTHKIKLLAELGRLDSARWV